MDADGVRPDLDHRALGGDGPVLNNLACAAGSPLQVELVSGTVRHRGSVRPVVKVDIKFGYEPHSKPCRR